MLFLLLGLGIGGLYTISALGAVMIYRGSRTLNFAHGAIATWGAFVFVELRDDLGLHGVVATGLVVVLAAMFGAIVYLLAMRPLRHATELTRALATVGLLVALQTGAIQIWGSEGRLVRSSLPNTTVEFAGANVGVDRIYLFAIAVAAVAALALASNRSRLMLATTAAAENERAAASLGVSPVVVGSVNWAIGCALAALAGSLLVPVLGLGVATVGSLLVPSLAAALVGRFQSFMAAAAGAMLLGVGEAFATRYVKTPGFGSAIPILVVLVVLLARRPESPNRLMGQVAARVAAGAGRPWLLGGIAAAVLVIVAIAPREWVDASVTSMCWALLALSLVVLIGYSNQISLAQLAIAGLAAWCTVRFVEFVPLPFVVQPIVGAVVGAAVGVVFGVPALRVRGINLAVVTLALGLAIERLVFQNSSLTGGFSGIELTPPELFGASVDPLEHPRAYALVTWCFAVLAFGLVIRLRGSRVGRQLLALRTNERAAASIGVGIARAKLQAFVASAALAGMAGVLMTYQRRFMTFESFTVARSIALVPVAVIGGIGSSAGAAIAGVIANGGLLMRAVDNAGVGTHVVDLVLGLALIVALRVHPDGIAGVGRGVSRAPSFTSSTSRSGAPLCASAVTVRFGGVTAVQAASLSVMPGAVVGLVGPNGAGKTTMLDALSGFAPSTGEVRLDDVGLGDSRPHQRARAGLARTFQGLEMFEDLTVAENLALAAESAGFGRGVLPVPALAAIERFELRQWFDRRPSDLPSGVRRSVALARALAANPRVLLLDEPGAGLSGPSVVALAGQVRELASTHDIGVLLVDHDMDLIATSCDEVIVMDRGSVIADGRPEDVLADARVRSAYLGRDATEGFGMETACSA